jgi:hypothetical protein
MGCGAAFIEVRDLEGESVEMKERGGRNEVLGRRSHRHERGGQGHMGSCGVSLGLRDGDVTLA